METDRDNQERPRIPAWLELKGPDRIVLSTGITYYRNYRAFADAVRKGSLDEITQKFCRHVSVLREADANPPEILNMQNDSEQLFRLAGRRMVPGEVLQFSGGKEISLILDRDCRNVFLLNQKDHLLYAATVPGLAGGHDLAVQSLILDSLDQAFGLERMDDGSVFSHREELGGECARVSVTMNLAASVVYGYRPCMSPLAEAFNLRLGNWSETREHLSGLLRLDGVTQPGETVASCMERVSRAVRLLENVELEARDGIRSNPSPLYEHLHREIGMLLDVKSLEEEEAMMCLSLLWMAYEIGMLPDFRLMPLQLWMLEMNDARLQDIFGGLEECFCTMDVFRGLCVRKMLLECMNLKQ